MDGAARVFAVPSEIELGGKKYAAKGRIARHHAQMEAYLLAKRPNPIEVVRDNLALFEDFPAVQEMLIDRGAREAFRARNVTNIEIAEWMDSMDGRSYVVWLAIRDEYPEFESHEQVKALLLDEIEKDVTRMVEAGEKEADAQEIAAAKVCDKIDDAINTASGEDLAGNSTGPSAT